MGVALEGVAVLVSVAVGVAVSVAVDVLVRVSVRVAEGEGVKVNVGVNDGVGVVLGVAVGVLPIGSNGRNNKPVQKQSVAMRAAPAINIPRVRATPAFCESYLF